MRNVLSKILLIILIPFLRFSFLLRCVDLQ
uniref:Uncharacterized protein n=1 Tax=Anguilla anguilla TaxID=7936 RepID=A0A0E9W0H9_ANGAN